MAVLQTSALSTGPQVTRFEKALCEYLRVKYAVIVNSGTSALQLAVETLQLAPGTKVILPSFAFAAPLNVLLQRGLQPVFVDIEVDSFNTTADKIEAAIAPGTSAIIVIHTFGRPLDMLAICDVARRHNLLVIEDACEALGTEIHHRKAGTFGDAGILAFYPNKQITTGEGGALITGREDISNHAQRLRNQGRDSSLDWLQQTEVGYSYRLSDINCALGVSQVQRIEGVVATRQRLAEIYDQKLKLLPEIQRPSMESPNGRISWFCYVIRLAEAFNREQRDKVCEFLIERGIGCGRYFAPLHRQPVVAPMSKNFQLPVTDFVADRVIALPFFNQMTEAEVEVVVDGLAESLVSLRRK